MAADILLKVGVDTSEVRAVRQRINAELGGVGGGTVIQRGLVNINRQTQAVQKNTAAVRTQTRVGRTGNRVIADTSKQHKDLTKSQGRTVASAFKWAAVYTVVYRIIRGGFDVILNAIKLNFQLELSIARINIVSEEFQQRTGEVQAGFKNLATTFGVSVTEIAEAARLFAQQGLTVEETIDLTTTALAGSVISGRNLQQVVEDLTAVMRAFKIPAADSIIILDKFIKVSSRTAVTAITLAEAVRRVGATAITVGVTLDELNGFVVAIGEQTRRTGQQIGTALRTIFVRIPRRETIKAFREIGVEVLDTEGELRNLTDVLIDVRRGFNNLTGAQQINIAQTAAGIRRVDIFLTLIRNLDRALFAQVQSLRSTGKTLDALNKVMDSAQKTSDRLAQNFAIFNANVLNSFGIIESLNGIFIILNRTFAAADENINKVREALEKLGKVGESLPFVIKAVLAGVLPLQNAFINLFSGLREIGADPVADFEKDLQKLIDGKQIRKAQQTLKEIAKESFKEIESPEIGKRLTQFIRLSQDRLNIIKEEVLDLDELKTIIFEITEQRRVELALLELSGATQVQLKLREAELLREERDLIGNLRVDQEAIQKKINEFDKRKTGAIKAQNDAFIEQQKIIAEIGDELEDSVANTLKEIIKGTATWGDLLDNIGNVVLDNIVDNFVQGIARQTDIFQSLAKNIPAIGQFFPGAVSPGGELKQGVIDGSKEGAKILAEGVRAGITGESVSQSSTGSAAAIFGGGIKGGDGASIADFIRKNVRTSEPLPGLARFIKTGFPTKGVPTEILKKSAKLDKETAAAIKEVAKNTKRANVTKAFKGALDVAGGAIAGFAAAKASGGSKAAQAAGAVGGGLLAIAPFTGPAAPFVAAAGALLQVGSILFGKGNKSIEIKDELKNNRAAITITNKELEIVNLNLSAIRRQLDPFVLPESAFFSQRIPGGLSGQGSTVLVNINTSAGPDEVIRVITNAFSTQSGSLPQ